MPGPSHLSASDRSSPLYLATGAYLFACLVLGGASQANDGFDLALRLGGVPILIWSGLRLTGKPLPAGAGLLLLFLGSLALLPAVQLIPLPPGVWASLPGRTELARDLDMAGVVPSWRPLSLTPEATTDALLGLIPFAAVLAAAISLPARDRVRLWIFTAAVAFLSVALGALQIASGQSGGFRLYEDAGGSATGFFANRNHWAAGLAATLPVLAHVLADRAGGQRLRPLTVAVLLAVFVALMAGVAISGSRAGAVLLGLAVAGSIALLLTRQRSQPQRSRGPLLLAGVAGSAGVVFAVIGAWAAASRFVDAPEDLRFDLWADTLRQALVHLPFGTGAGSFGPIYLGAESAGRLTAGFANQAHNDWIEILLEHGVLAALPIGLAVAAVQRGRRRAESAFILLALGILLAASLVDYPLRTPALQALAALLIASLAVRPRTTSRPG